MVQDSSLKTEKSHKSFAVVAYPSKEISLDNNLNVRADVMECPGACEYTKPHFLAELSLIWVSQFGPKILLVHHQSAQKIKLH